MAERISLELTVPQIDAAVKALKQCGVETQDTGRLQMIFHDPELVVASKQVLKILSSAEKRSMSKSYALDKSDIQREIDRTSPIDLLKTQNNKLKEDLVSLYGAHSRLVDSVQSAIDNLQESNATAVRSQLEKTMHEIAMDEFLEEHPFLR